MKRDNDLVRDLVYHINEFARELKIEPHQLKPTKFLKKYKQFSAYDLKKIGGFKSFLKAEFPQPDKDLKTIEREKHRSSYVNKLERLIGTREAFREKIINDLSNVISRIKIDTKHLDAKTTHKYLESLKVESTDKESRSVVTLWSDQHFGENVDKQEVGGKNEFNWIIGARRLGMFCEQIATYKIEKRQQHEELVILMLGDNIGGLLYNQEGSTYDLMIHQIAGTTAYYIQAINYLKQFFPKVRVICQPGNHGRVQHKASKKRALSQKYDSFENIIFNSLSWQFKTDSKVQIEISKAPFSDVLIQGHRVYATHGDTVFETGNVGKSLPIEKIEVQVNKINANELALQKCPYEMFCSGHVHHPLFTQVGPGVAVAINGCLIGLDSYAHGIKIHSSTAVQLIWETTKKYVQGDTRKIFVDKADDKFKYEKIIKPYNYQLGAY